MYDWRSVYTGSDFADYGVDTRPQKLEMPGGICYEVPVCLVHRELG